MIAPQVLALSLFLSVTWGIWLVYSIVEYRHTLTSKPRPRGALVVAFRRLMVSLCLWLICFSYVFRTICVLIGIDGAVTGQIIFFALIGSNVVGSIFAIASLKFD